LLWLSYKDRLGVLEFSEILDLLSKLIESSNLPILDDPFSMEEILVVLKEIPFDHVLRPNGFNGAFFKKR
jgi:hypothetical protein